MTSYSSPLAPTVSADRDYRRLRPGPGQPRHEVTANQRTRIQQAMVELVAAGGYESVTVRKLARVAHVSTGTFYSQFDGTDHCFLETYEALLDQVQQQVVASRAPGCDRRQQATRSLRALVGGITQDWSAARVILIEVFSGGPAALNPAKERETRLETALKQSLDRRDDSVSATTVAWIAAGALHWARTRVGANPDRRDPQMVERMATWGQAIADRVETRARVPLRALRRRPTHPQAILDIPAGSDERQLLLSAATKLAATDGYWKLSASGISKAAGVPVTRFKRHFASTEEIYLAAVRTITSELFAPLITEVDAEETWEQGAGRAVSTLCKRAAGDRGTARLALAGVLEPGREGLTCRASLIAELAHSWRSKIPVADRPHETTAEAAVAALWAALARALEGGYQERLPGTAATFTHLLIAAARPSHPNGFVLGRVATAG